MEPSLNLNRQEKEWNKQLSHHVDRYSYLRDWSELASWLAKLKSHLQDYRGIVLDKNTLLKKLSTSLNASLPVALHQTTLEIYELLFAKNLIIQCLELACLGLFSFFSSANIKNKQKLIQIFTRYFPTYKQQLRILASGLLITILPALCEMHEPLVKDTQFLLDVLNKEDVLGQKILVQSIWISISRSPACRVPGLKYLSSKMGKGVQDDANDEEQDTFWNDGSQNISGVQVQLEQVSQQVQQQNSPKVVTQTLNKITQIRQFCPHTSTLVVNALISCIQDQNTLAIKAALDFLFKYLPLKSQLLSTSSKMKLCKPIIWLLGKRDVSVTRKINLWLFGKPNVDNKFQIQKKQLEYVITTVSDFLRNDETIQPLKITLNLYNEHEDMPAMSLKYLAKDIIQFSLKMQNNPQVGKTVQRLVDKIRKKISILSQSIGNYLISCIEKQQYQQASKTLKLIIHMIDKILKQNEVKQLVFPTLKSIMKSYEKISVKNQLYMQHALQVSLDLLEKYKDIFVNIRQQVQNDQTLQNHIVLFQALQQNLKSDTQKLYKILSRVNKMQMKLYQIFGVYNQQWVPILVQISYLRDTQYYLQPIEAIGEGLQKEGKLKLELMKRSQQTKNNFIINSISKLWNTLSLSHLQGKAVPLLLKLSKFFPHFFNQVLQREFLLNNEASIIKFSLFWTISPKYPTILTHQHLAQISKKGLFKMLDFLDNGNPLIKYNTNIWVNETFPNFNRVLDPLLQIMLMPADCWYKTPKGQFVYSINPDSNKLLNTLKQLHSVIKHTIKNFFRFSLKPITHILIPYYQTFKGSQLEGSTNEKTYLEVLFEVIVKFTLSKYTILENPGIDLISCEILETIIKNIHEPKLCAQVLRKNILSIVHSLHFATINQQHLLQIQLINLLKIVFFQSELKKSGQVKILKSVISSPYYLTTILQGLDSQFPYIKERFVQFISQSIPFIVQFHTNFSQVVSRILNVYTSRIMIVNSKKLQAEEKDIEISRKNAQILILFNGVKDLLTYFLNFELKPFQKQKNQAQTDVGGVFSFHCWKAYLTLKIDKKVNISKKYSEQIAKQLLNELYQLLLTMCSCWTMSPLKPLYNFQTYGIKKYTFTEFHNFVKQFEQVMAMSKYQTEQTVQNFILNFARVLLNKYPSQIMNSMIQNWASAPTIEAKLKILQILNLCHLPIQLFFRIMTDCCQNNYAKKKSSHYYMLPSQQPSLLQLCQAFTDYSYLDTKSNTFLQKNFVRIWFAFLKFIKCFEGTKNVLVIFALLELINTFVKKFNPTELLRNEKFRKQSFILNNFVSQVINICGGKVKFTKPNHALPYNVFEPLPTSIVELKFELQKKRGQQNLQQKYSEIFFEVIDPDHTYEHIRKMGLIVLKKIGFFLMQVFSLDEAILVKKIRQLITLMLSIVEDKTLSNQLIERASQVIQSTLSQKKSIYCREFKYEILHIFNKDDFFICSSKTLHCWVQIIDMIIDSNKDHDIFTEYLEKVSLVSSIFSNYTAQTKKKIKSFERICFILYAGKVDKHIDKTHVLIDKIIEVIKNSDAPQPVLILIFFCIRILILRVSPDRLTKLFSNLWQLIMFLLINIFKKAQIETGKNQMNLIWAALKLIQMVSIMQMNEFHPHQWIFFYDFVGIKFGSAVDLPSLGFKGKPLINRFLPNIKPYWTQQSTQNQIRHLIIKEDKIDDIDLLKTKTLSLCSYLIASNQNKIEVELKEIQDLIEKDFLNLDDFIYKVK